MRNKGKKIINVLVYTISILLTILLVGVIFIKASAKIDAPVVDESAWNLQRVDHGDGFYTLNNNWFRKSKSGLFEMYVEGEPFQRGVFNGKLTRELVVRQENHFNEQINKM